jgi:hypothetical protein
MQDGHFWAFAGEEMERLISRSVIHDNDLVKLLALPPEAVKMLPQNACPVVRHGNARN